MSDTMYSIQESTLQGLGDALRDVWGTEETFTPAQMIGAINDVGQGTWIDMQHCANPHVDPLTNEWARPSKYPDLNALRDEIEGDQDCVYFTYDLSLHENYHWLGLQVTMSSGDKWYLDRYDEGNFVHSHFELNANAYFRYDLTEEPDDSDVQVWRLTSNGHISNYGFITNTDSTSTSFTNALQPCVDRSGTLPWVTPATPSVGRHPTSKINITYWLEHDGLIIGKNAYITTLSSYWAAAYDLVSIDTNEWDTENWAITSLVGAWQNCHSLKKLDLNNWDTENWSVTNLGSTWASCHSLEQLNVDRWNTENWAVTNLSSAWSGCYSLKKLDLNNWNTENWTVTSLSNTWSSCHSLQYLNISNWNTENWAVTSMGNTWYSCYSLKKLNIENWDTENWEVTTLSSVWQNCYSLKKLDLNNWDTENWAVTTISYIWNNCQALKLLNINSWNTENWAVTSLSSAWSNCSSLKELKLNDWDTENWAVTTLSSTWQGCYSLKKLEIDSWKTDDWPVTTIASMCASCSSLLELDLSKWNTSNWAVTSASSAFSGCMSLRYLNIKTWDTSNWQLSSITNFVYYCYSLLELDIGNWNTTLWKITSAGQMFTQTFALRTIKLPAIMLPIASTTSLGASPDRLKNYTGTNICTNADYSNSLRLTPASLKSILNRLQTVSSTKTITLGPQNLLKLTAEDIAVATNKGWTVA